MCEHSHFPWSRTHHTYLCAAALRSDTLNTTVPTTTAIQTFRRFAAVYHSVRHKTHARENSVTMCLEPRACVCTGACAVLKCVRAFAIAYLYITSENSRSRCSTSTVHSLVCVFRLRSTLYETQASTARWVSEDSLYFSVDGSCFADFGRNCSRCVRCRYYCFVCFTFWLTIQSFGSYFIL